MSVKKAVSILLLVLLFVTMLFGWTGIKKQYRENFLVNLIGENIDKDSIEDAAEEISSLLGVDMGSGSKKVLKKATGIVKAIKDGRVSPFEMSRILGSASYISRQAAKMAKQFDDFFGSSMSSQMKGVKRGVGFVNFLYTLVLILLVVAIIASVIMRLSGKRGFKGIIIALTAIMLIIFLILTGALNGASGKIFAVTAWPFIGLIFAIASAITGPRKGEVAVEAAGAEGTVDAAEAVNAVKDSIMGSVNNLKAAVAEKIPAAKGWTCPNCSAKCEGAFCTKCGTKRPEEAFCPNCGEKVSGAFCTKCGTKI